MKRSTHCSATQVGPHPRVPGPRHRVGPRPNHTESWTRNSGVGPNLSPPKGTGPGPSGARRQPAYLVPEVWGELSQDGGICRESRPPGSGSGPTLHPAPSPERPPFTSPEWSATHPPVRRRGRLLRRTNQTQQGNPPCETEKGFVGPWTFLCVCHGVFVCNGDDCVCVCDRECEAE